MKEDVNILLVDDSDEDTFLIKRVLKKKKLDNKFYRLENGLQAVNYLFGQERIDEANKPELILLDIDMPDMGGIDVLKRIKSEQVTKDIPVVMLTASLDEETVAQSYLEGANSYVSKPTDYESFNKVVDSILDYWLKVNKKA